MTIEKERATEAGARNHQLKQQLRCSSEKVEELEKTVGELRKASVHSDVLVLQKEVENYKKMCNDAQSRIEVLETEKNKFGCNSRTTQAFFHAVLNSAFMTLHKD